LVAKQEANALLNSQVDLLTKQLQELQAGKAAYEKHFKDLSALLAKERSKNTPDSKVWCDLTPACSNDINPDTFQALIPAVDTIAGWRCSA